MNPLTRTARPDPSPSRSSGPPVPVRPEIALGCFGLGLLLPLLGGGNVLLSLEPELATPLLLAASASFAVLSIRRPASSPAAGPSAIETVALLVLLAWWWGNLLARPSGPRAAIEAQAVAAGALLFLALSWRPLREEETRGLIRGIGVGAFVTTIYGQYQYWIMFPALAPRMAEIYGIGLFVSVNANFYNANSYAPFLAATILLLAGAASAEDRVSTGLILFPLFATLLLTESRATVALLVAAGFLLLAATRLDPRRRRRALVLLGAGALAAAWLGSRWIALEELWGTALPGRIDIWRGALAMIREHWLLGVGLGRFAEHFPAYQVTDYYTRYPHSLPLEVLAETGIVGLTALGTFLVAAFARSLRSAGAGASALSRHALGAAALLLAHAMVDIDWHAPANPVLLMMLLAVSRRPGVAIAC